MIFESTPPTKAAKRWQGVGKNCDCACKKARIQDNRPGRVDINQCGKDGKKFWPPVVRTIENRTLLCKNRHDMSKL